jgi:hypothetical protein
MVGSDFMEGAGYSIHVYVFSITWIGLFGFNPFGFAPPLARLFMSKIEVA